MVTRDKKLTEKKSRPAIRTGDLALARLAYGFVCHKVVIVLYIQQVIGQSLCAYFSRACVGIKSRVIGQLNHPVISPQR